MRQREEVLNVTLAECIVSRGMNAAPETIQRRGSARPDVFINFRGLRCAIEGKIDETSGVRESVAENARSRTNIGVAQLGVAVLYPKVLRETAFSTLRNAIEENRLEFKIFSESSVTGWVSGNVDTLLESLRRAQEEVATDDAVRSAAEELAIGLEDVANAFLNEPATCERLIDTLGIGVKDKKNENS